jgi:hypothetical protein
MAKEKADSDTRGWFARWRERRKQSKLRAGQRQRRLDDAESGGEQWAARHGPPPSPGGMGGLRCERQ